MIGCKHGGTSIEDLAEKFPDQIVKIPIDISEGLTDVQTSLMVEGLAVTGDKAAAMDQIRALYQTFVDCDCTMVEVNNPGPLISVLDSNFFSEQYNFFPE